MLSERRRVTRGRSLHDALSSRIAGLGGHVLPRLHPSPVLDSSDFSCLGAAGPREGAASTALAVISLHLHHGFLEHEPVHGRSRHARIRLPRPRSPLFLDCLLFSILRHSLVCAILTVVSIAPRCACCAPLSSDMVNYDSAGLRHRRPCLAV